MIAQTSTRHGIVSETNVVTSDQKRVLDALRVKPPARFPHVRTPTYLEVPTRNQSDRTGSPYRKPFTPPLWHYGLFSASPTNADPAVDSVGAIRNRASS